MANAPLPSPEMVRKLLSYDPETGLLYWLPRPIGMFPNKRIGASWNSRYAGKMAFTADRVGYRQGCIFKKKFSAHRVAFAIHFGRWPNGEIDHINGDRADNRIVNLREVTRQENARNICLRSNNKSGHVGVSLNKVCGRWQAHITVDSKMRHLGFYDTKKEAISARMEASRRFNFHDNHGRPSP